jgi:phosphoglycolate phosphatase
MFYIKSEKRPLHHSKPYENLIFCFDLDGTLVDTAPDLVRVTNETIAKEGLEPTHYKTARSEVGYGSRVLIKNACVRARRKLSNSRLDELQSFFLERYAETIAEHSLPFPGVIDTLHTLRKGGARLTVCTNKPGYLARPLLRELGMTHFFERIIGGDEAPKAKPDARHIFMAVGAEGARKHIIMVGDSYPDIRAAHNARVPSILMRYGYTQVKPYKLRPTLSLDHFKDIPHCLSQIYEKS